MSQYPKQYSKLSYLMSWVTRTLLKFCSKKEITHISLLLKVPLEGHLNVVEENRECPFLEGHYLVNILVSFKKKME